MGSEIGPTLDDATVRHIVPPPFFEPAGWGETAAHKQVPWGQRSAFRRFATCITMTHLKTGSGFQPPGHSSVRARVVGARGARLRFGHEVARLQVRAERPDGALPRGSSPPWMPKSPPEASPPAPPLCPLSRFGSLSLSHQKMLHWRISGEEAWQPAEEIAQRKAASSSSMHGSGMNVGR